MTLHHHAIHLTLDIFFPILRQEYSYCYKQVELVNRENHEKMDFTKPFFFFRFSDKSL